MAIAISVGLNHWFEKREFLGAREVLQIWSRFVLDSAMVMGICGTMIGILSMIANVGGDDQYDTAHIFQALDLLFSLLRGAGASWGCICHPR